MPTSLKIIFYGTPDFAVESLDILIQNNYNIIAVVTAPDKPAGRGHKLQQSAVKKYALAHNLNLLQPTNLKSKDFHDELTRLVANLQIVVAFRMLPESVWNMPKIGTFNLHGSLLPQYRGAAPIHWAVINGEKETGVTTFFLQHEIDTGAILFHEKTAISESDNTGIVHDKLMDIGAKLVLKTVQAIEINDYTATQQSEFISNSNHLKNAPKLNKNNCKIDWNDSLANIHNKIRGLSPFPIAWTEFQLKNKLYTLKIIEATKEKATHSFNIGTAIQTKTELKVAVANGFINISKLQLSGKKRMNTSDLIRGFSFEGVQF